MRDSSIRADLTADRITPETRRRIECSANVPFGRHDCHGYA